MMIVFSLCVPHENAWAAPIAEELAQLEAQVGMKAVSDRARLRAQTRFGCGAKVSLSPTQIGVPHSALRWRMNPQVAWAMQRRSSPGANA
jgi:citrate lyase beta subunit